MARAATSAVYVAVISNNVIKAHGGALRVNCKINQTKAKSMRTPETLGGQLNMTAPVSSRSINITSVWYIWDMYFSLNACAAKKKSARNLSFLLTIFLFLGLKVFAQGDREIALLLYVHNLIVRLPAELRRRDNGWISLPFSRTFRLALVMNVSWG